MLASKLAAVMLIGISTQAAIAAPSCSVKFKGKVFLDNLPCDVSSKDGVITFEQGNFFTAEVKNGILRSNVKRFHGPKALKYTLDSFGRAKETPGEDGLCYTTSELEVCSSGGDPD